MEALLRGVLMRSAGMVGIAVPSDPFTRAVEVGLAALAEGHDFDVAAEVARSVLLKSVQTLTAA